MQEVHVDAMGMAGTLAMTGVVLVWGLWLARRDGASRLWRLVPFAVLPCVAVPATLAVIAEPALQDVAHGILFTFAVLVSIGTLFHAGRAEHHPG